MLKYLKPALLVAVLVFMIVAGMTVEPEALLDPEYWRSQVEQLGVIAPLAYIVMFAFGQPFVLPGFVFILTASAIWPFGEALLYSWCGAMGAAAVGFAFARYLGREYAERFLPEGYQQFNRLIEQNAFRTVVIARLILGLSSLVTFGLAISRISFRTNMLATAVTLIWPIAIITFFGDAFFGWVSGLSSNDLWVLAALIGGVFILRFYFKRKRQSVLADIQAKTPVIIDAEPIREESTAKQIE